MFALHENSTLFLEQKNSKYYIRGKKKTDESLLRNRKNFKTFLFESYIFRTHLFQLPVAFRIT